MERVGLKLSFPQHPGYIYLLVDAEDFHSYLGIVQFKVAVGHSEGSTDRLCSRGFTHEINGSNSVVEITGLKQEVLCVNGIDDSRGSVIVCECCVQYLKWNEMVLLISKHRLGIVIL